MKNSSLTSAAFEVKRLDAFSGASSRSKTGSNVGGSAFALDKQNATGFMSQPIALRPLGGFRKRSSPDRKTGRGRHRLALTMPEHSAERMFRETSRNMGKLNESDDARSCGSLQLFRVPLDPCYDLGDVRYTLNFLLASGDQLHPLGQMFCNAVTIKQRSIPVSNALHIVF